MKEDQKIFKERINYTIDSGKYVGYSVNVPGIIVQANSLEEMETRVRAVFQSWMEFMSQTLAMEEPFEYKELSNSEWFAQHK